MRRILTLRQKDIVPLAAKEPDRSRFFFRESARAVLLDETSKVALMYSKKNKYYKLPGGGVDEGESPETALQHEIREETGYVAVLGKALGEAVEYRDYVQMVQTSFCYLATIVSEGVPALTAEEVHEGFVVAWASDIRQAIGFVAMSDDRDNMQVMFMKRRELAILRAAQQLIA
jgi:ADP-ribose pyrophosphatase YjhB (NUDIX family)